MNIHPLALVSPDVHIARNVRIGPFCVVESGVTIGAGCVLESNVIVKADTALGEKNHVFEGSVLGGPPQHVHAPESSGRVVIGSGNTIRENVTIHRALERDHATCLGNSNLVMANAHIAHDCHIGNNTIIVNNVMLAGHVTVEDRAYLSGGVGVHQFCRIGALAMVGGQAHINKDVPPYVTIDGISSFVVGLNQIGLRRAGYDPQTIQQLKAAYRVIYRSGLSWTAVLERLDAEFREGAAAAFYPFLSATVRGIVGERRMPAGATIKLPVVTQPGEELEGDDTAAKRRAKAG